MEDWLKYLLYFFLGYLCHKLFINYNYFSVGCQKMQINKNYIGINSHWNKYCGKNHFEYAKNLIQMRLHNDLKNNVDNCLLIDNDKGVCPTIQDSYNLSIKEFFSIANCDNIDKYEMDNKKTYHIKNGISNWDVSGIKDLSYLFFGTLHINFNANLGNWDVKNATNMDHMFYNQSKFTGLNLNKWEVDNVTNMDFMFYNAERFNEDISNWNVNKVTKMQSMFHNCKYHNVIKSAKSWYDTKKLSSLNSEYKSSIEVFFKYLGLDPRLLENSGI